MKTPVKFSEIEDAVNFVSSGEDFRNVAYINRITGEIHWHSEEFCEEELPNDVESSKYIKVPSKRELNLGTQLVFLFADQQLDVESREVIHQIFRSREAYRRFKDFLYIIEAIERWYEFENNALRHKLHAWGEEYGIEIVG